ncbi:hypothetical protein ACFQER_18130 [Halomicroarcula sp. GCM10025894]|uniref:hypothetical protein n=1 Tax=Halomicroarcula sp. GCM10025894 TaxID=3252673 RepID=UPI003609B6D6
MAGLELLLPDVAGLLKALLGHLGGLLDALLGHLGGVFGGAVDRLEVRVQRLPCELGAAVPEPAGHLQSVEEELPGALLEFDGLFQGNLDGLVSASWPMSRAFCCISIALLISWFVCCISD